MGAIRTQVLCEKEQYVLLNYWAMAPDPNSGSFLCLIDLGAFCWFALSACFLF